MSALPPIRWPDGRWAVAVSGGADSVALLRIAQAQRPADLHVVHLNHQTRGVESDADADFVASLARQFDLPATVRRLCDVLESLSPDDRAALPTNPSARYRALRLHLYRQVVASERLDGVLLAHHADDQAETVFLRLVRGTGYSALAGMRNDVLVRGVRVVRPMLRIERRSLRARLLAIGQTWREDTSNSSGDYARNRVRRALKASPHLSGALIALADACQSLHAWTAAHTPLLPPAFHTADVADLPDILALSAVAAWLSGHGVPAADLSPAHSLAVLTMCRDAASPATHNVPGAYRVRRQKDWIRCVAPETA
jgi:tRNA(Ile)-lysidine synthetase-like protein